MSSQSQERIAQPKVLQVLHELDKLLPMDINEFEKRFEDLSGCEALCFKGPIIGLFGKQLGLGNVLKLDNVFVLDSETHWTARCRDTLITIQVRAVYVDYKKQRFLIHFDILDYIESRPEYTIVEIKEPEKKTQ
jgi:hypothetical protein